MAGVGIGGGGGSDPQTSQDARARPFDVSQAGQSQCGAGIILLLPSVIRVMETGSGGG